MYMEKHLLYSQIEISKKNNKRDITKMCPFLSPFSFRASLFLSFSLFLLLFLTYFFIITYSYTYNSFTYNYAAYVKRVFH
jgi:hypothetical protein